MGPCLRGCCLLSLLSIVVTCSVLSRLCFPSLFSVAFACSGLRGRCHLFLSNIVIRHVLFIFVISGILSRMLCCHVCIVSIIFGVSVLRLGPCGCLIDEDIAIRRGWCIVRGWLRYRQSCSHGITYVSCFGMRFSVRRWLVLTSTHITISRRCIFRFLCFLIGIGAQIFTQSFSLVRRILG